MDAYDERRLFGLLLVVMLLLAGLLAPAAYHPMPLKAPPQLLDLASQQPAEQVRLIVQHTESADRLAREVAARGGTVVGDLSLIRSLVVVLPAGQVAALARSEQVRWISWDAPTQSSTTSCAQCISTTNLRNNYIRVIGADQVWNSAPYLQGQGIGVAVVDSGMNKSHSDIQGRVVAEKSPGLLNLLATDGYGHGSHVAGIVGGRAADGGVLGVAPQVKLINVKVSDEVGAALTSDVIMGLQWIYLNKSRYNIRVVNLSLNAGVPDSYHMNPLNAAVEVLWFSGVVVVVSAGNSGHGGVLPPANDPFVITVGSTHDQGTAATSDDALASFSAYGTTDHGISKPDLVTPGTRITSLLATPLSILALTHLDRIDGNYFVMSGTSMSAPMVAGAAALLLQDEPDLTPDQVKHRLVSSATPLPFAGAGAGYLNIPAAIQGSSKTSANTGVQMSKMLWGSPNPVTWDSVSWNSVSWNSVSWNSTYWGP